MITSHFGIELVVGPMTNDNPPESSVVVGGSRGQCLNPKGAHLAYDFPGCYGLVLNAANENCNSVIICSAVGGDVYAGQIYFDSNSSQIRFNIRNIEIMRINLME